MLGCETLCLDEVVVMYIHLLIATNVSYNCRGLLITFISTGRF